MLRRAGEDLREEEGEMSSFNIVVIEKFIEILQDFYAKVWQIVMTRKIRGDYDYNFSVMEFEEVLSVLQQYLIFFQSRLKEEIARIDEREYERVLTLINVCEEYINKIDNLLNEIALSCNSENPPEL